MDRKMNKIAVLLAGVALSACTVVEHKVPDTGNTLLHYSCGTTPLSVTLDKATSQVSLILDGIQLHLPQVKAASGTRYSDGRYTFWSKGNAALVQRGDDVIIDDCQLTP